MNNMHALLWIGVSRLCYRWKSIKKGKFSAYLFKPEK